MVINGKGKTPPLSFRAVPPQVQTSPNKLRQTGEFTPIQTRVALSPEAQREIALPGLPLADTRDSLPNLPEFTVFVSPTVEMRAIAPGGCEFDPARQLQTSFFRNNGFQVAIATQTAGRESNQDFAATFSIFFKARDDKGIVLPKQAMVAVVADGVGGRKGGAQASQKAIEIFRAELQSLSKEYESNNLSVGDSAIKEIMLKAFDKTAEELSKASTGQEEIGSTTFTVGVIYNGCLYSISIGDSKQILARNQKIIAMNVDDSKSQVGAAGSEIVDVSDKKNVILGCLGKKVENYQPVPAPLVNVGLCNIVWFEDLPLSADGKKRINEEDAIVVFPAGYWELSTPVSGTSVAILSRKKDQGAQALVSCFVLTEEDRVVLSSDAFDRWDLIQGILQRKDTKEALKFGLEQTGTTVRPKGDNASIIIIDIMKTPEVTPIEEGSLSQNQSSQQDQGQSQEQPQDQHSKEDQDPQTPKKKWYRFWK